MPRHLVLLNINKTLVKFLSHKNACQGRFLFDTTAEDDTFPCLQAFSMEKTSGNENSLAFHQVFKIFNNDLEN